MTQLTYFNIYVTILIISVAKKHKKKTTLAKSSAV